MEKLGFCCFSPLMLLGFLFVMRVTILEWLMWVSPAVSEMYDELIFEVTSAIPRWVGIILVLALVVYAVLFFWWVTTLPGY
jgi:hypothetical protein